MMSTTATIKGSLAPIGARRHLPARILVNLSITATPQSNIMEAVGGYCAFPIAFTLCALFFLTSVVLEIQPSEAGSCDGLSQYIRFHGVSMSVHPIGKHISHSSQSGLSSPAVESQEELKLLFSNLTGLLQSKFVLGSVNKFSNEV